ncbi:acetyltransferase, GNAT family [Lachnospiraceae bacterium KM106-2]|nr:acetyltransferase, GNAT family [Lachnospiraceae bacterium KM106-2]
MKKRLILFEKVIMIVLFVFSILMCVVTPFGWDEQLPDWIWAVFLGVLVLIVPYMLYAFVHQIIRITKEKKWGSFTKRVLLRFVYFFCISFVILKLLALSYSKIEYLLFTFFTVCISIAVDDIEDKNKTTVRQLKVYPVKDADLAKIKPLFDNWQETLIWSCLQGVMGQAWTNDLENPTSAKIQIADFCFLAGEMEPDFFNYRHESWNTDFTIMVPQNEEWASLIEEHYGDNAKRVTRYAIKKESDIFNRERLQQFIDGLDSEYEVKMIEGDLFIQAKQNHWSADLCSQFPSYEEYKEKGIGAVVVHKGEIVSGASSYTVYKEGIEIEIDTREDYRRKGLAAACGAKLILACLDRGLYPSWDAQNLGSVALAEKLGYHMDHEYVAYEVKL